MQNKGVVFDFNGTLFWDTKEQNDSWDVFLENYGLELSEVEKNKWVHGINAKDTFEYLFKRPVDNNEVDCLTEEKEVIYREMCLNEGMKWAPGALELIHFLKENNIPMAIATASAKNNVEFFIEQLDLLDHFKREHIIYNDGTLRGKPHPDLFTKAIEVLGLPAKNVTVFEDSLAGVEAAENAGAGAIIIVNGNEEHAKRYTHPIISHFNEFDRSSLVSNF